MEDKTELSVTYVTDLNKIKNTPITSFCKVFSKTLCKVYHEGEGKYKYYALIDKEYSKFFPDCYKNVYCEDCISLDDEGIQEQIVEIRVIPLTKIIIKKCKEDERNLNLIEYAFVKTYHPELIFKARVEHKILYQLMVNLYELCSFKAQHNVLGYRVDCLFVLRFGTLNNDIPNVAFEIDENNHKDRKPEDEEKRAKIIKGFNNRLVRISINRKANEDQINEVIKRAEKEIRKAFEKLLVNHSSILTLEHFLDIVEENNLDRELVGLLFPKLSDDDKNNVFRINHEKLGEYLEYKCNETEGYHGHNHFVDLIKKELDENDDYIIIKTSIRRSTGEYSKLGGKPRNIYMLSRTAVYDIFMSSGKPKAREARKKMVSIYEAAVDICCRLRAKDREERKRNIPKLIDERKKERNERKPLNKAKKEIVVLANKLQLAEEKIKELEDMLKQKKKVISDMKIKRSVLTGERNEYKDKYIALKKAK